MTLEGWGFAPCSFQGLRLNWETFASPHPPRCLSRWFQMQTGWRLGIFTPTLRQGIVSYLHLSNHTHHLQEHQQGQLNSDVKPFVSQVWKLSVGMCIHQGVSSPLPSPQLRSWSSLAEILQISLLLVGWSYLNSAWISYKHTQTRKFMPMEDNCI